MKLVCLAAMAARRTKSWSNYYSMMFTASRRKSCKLSLCIYSYRTAIFYPPKVNYFKLFTTIVDLVILCMCKDAHICIHRCIDL
jgi:hypothetical protein